MRTRACRILLLLLAPWLCAAGGRADNIRDLWQQLLQAKADYDQGQRDSALAKAKALVPAVTASGSALLIAMDHGLIGTIYMGQEKPQAAFDEWVLVANIAEANDFVSLARQPQYNFLYGTMVAHYAQLAMVGDELGHDEQSLRYAHKSMEWIERSKKPKEYFVALSVITEILLKHGELPTASLPADSARGPSETPPPDVTAIDPLPMMPPDMAATPPPADTLDVPSAPDTTAVAAADDEQPQAPPAETGEPHTSHINMASILLVSVAVAFACYVLWQRRVRKREGRKAEQLRAEGYLEGQESERSRLARELHDGVSNQLLAVEMKLAGEGASAQVRQLLSESREQVRRVSHELIPPEFSHATLDEVLASYVDELNIAQPCELTFTAAPPDADWHMLPDATALELYRIVQEAVGNALKHSGATVIAVGMHHQADEHTLELTVSDNGQPTQADAATTGIGLRTMSERAKSVGATLQFHHNGYGNVVELKLEI